MRDHIAGQGGWYDRDGNPTTIGSGAGVLYSDEMKDFEAFKKATGGVIHQHMRIKVDEWNQDLVAKKCEAFKILEHKRQVPDKRSKKGFREETYYTYEYYGKEYKTLKELNKKHIYITKDIHFNTLLDIIPYYPYIVCVACCNEGKETIFISDRSYVDEEEESALEHGWEHSMTNYYRKELQDHYREVVLRYFNPYGRENIELVYFDKDTLQGKVSKPIDYNFDIEWYFEDKPQTHWTSPKIVDAKNGIISISKEDYESYIGTSGKVWYVEYQEQELNLN